ncbi:hypothetical protein DFQ26_008181 [Actinomortierella ambigua]|nr:hypothetical protein DFQ26_008181 [Actinomortierella ambigua]
MTTPSQILRNSFVQHIRNADKTDICIVKWAHRRSQGDSDASQEVVLEDAFRYWVQELAEIVDMRVRCHATQDELKQALRIEKHCWTLVVQ